MTDISATLETLTWVRDRWPDLLKARLRGTPRPWHQTDETPPEVAAERDRTARLERIEADGRMPGYSLAPLHVDVLDTMAQVLMTADLLHEDIAQTVGYPKLAYPTARRGPGPYLDLDDNISPVPYLDYVVHLLDQAVDTDLKIAEHAARKAETMQTLIRTVLGEIVDGQLLDAICPFCLGVTPHHPAGGAKTMHFRLLPIPDQPATQGHVAVTGLVDPVIRCENPVDCKPFAVECGLWVKGQPAWRWPEWEWLAKRLFTTRRIA